MQISQNPPIEIFSDFKGINGRNNLFRVQLWTSAKDRLAVLSQEVFEHEHKRENMARYILTFFWPPARRRFREDMEIDGHAIEVAAGHAIYGRAVGTVEWQEAKSLLDPESSYHAAGMFKGLSVEDVVERLASRRDFARRWVARNRTRIDAWSAAIRTAV